MNLNFLPDMGRMILRLRSVARTTCLQAATPAATEQLPSTPSSRRPYAARGISTFMPRAELCRTGLFSPGFAVTGM
jgi:hypothetical protein